MSCPCSSKPRTELNRLDQRPQTPNRKIDNTHQGNKHSPTPSPKQTLSAYMTQTSLTLDIDSNPTHPNTSSHEAETPQLQSHPTTPPHRNEPAQKKKRPKTACLYRIPPRPSFPIPSGTPNEWIMKHNEQQDLVLSPVCCCCCDSPHPATSAHKRKKRGRRPDDRSDGVS